MNVSECSEFGDVKMLTYFVDLEVLFSIICYISFERAIPKKTLHLTILGKKILAVSKFREKIVRRKL